MSTFVVVGVLARFGVAGWGYNYDFESYLLVSESSLAGDGFFLPQRYTTGPIWGMLLTGLGWIAGGDPRIFRVLIISVLVIADLAIAALLARKVALVAGLLFLFRPDQHFHHGFSQSVRECGDRPCLTGRFSR